MFNKLNDILEIINHKYVMPDSTKKVLSDYVKAQNNQKAFNDLLAKVISKISELKEYGNVQHLNKYPIENEDTEKFLSKVFSMYLEIETLLSEDIITKLNDSDSKFLEQYKNDYREYKVIIEKEENAINNYNNTLNTVEGRIKAFFSKINFKEEMDSNLYVPLTLESDNECLEIINIFDGIRIPKELEYRVNVEKYENLLGNIEFLSNILALNAKYVDEFELKCISIQVEYIDELYKITNSKNGIVDAKIPLTGEEELFEKYSDEFNSLLLGSPKLKEYEEILQNIKFWENETTIFNNEINKRNEEYNSKEKVKGIQKKCLDCVMKVIDDLQISQVEDSLSKIKLPLTEAYIEEFNACFNEYESINPDTKIETSSDNYINSNFQFLDGFCSKIKAIISQDENISLFFSRITDLKNRCNIYLSSKKNGDFYANINEIEALYSRIQLLNNHAINNAYTSGKDMYVKACDRLKDYNSYKIDQSIRRENILFCLLICTLICITIAALGAYSYWGAELLRSGTLNKFPQLIYKAANIDWFHHWKNWGGDVWPVFNLFVWAFEGIWVAITWLIWAIVWLLLIIFCGLVFAICYVVVPAAAGMLIGVIFIGVNKIINKIFDKDDDSVIKIIIRVLTVIAFVALYILCFAL